MATHSGSWRLWGTLLAVVCCLSAPAQYGWCGWRTFTTADGLVENAVVSIVEDRSGDMWFATYAGVGRYDGVGWKAYTSANGLGNDLVHTMIEDRSGNLWFGTSLGLSRYDGSAWRTFTTADGLADSLVYAIEEDHAGALWFGTSGGLSRYDGTSWRTFRAADGLAADAVYSIFEDGSGNLWFGTNRGLSRYDGASWRTFTTADGLAANAVWRISGDRSGNLWIGYVEPLGVSRYDGASWRTFTTADGLASNAVYSTLEDRSGNLWFGTAYGGLSRYDGTRWRSLTTADGLAGNTVYSIVEDVSGNLWLGTIAGVSRFDGSTWASFTAAGGLAGNTVNSILEDRTGDLWFGTYGGVSHYDGSAWRNFTTADGLVDGYVNSILEDRSGNLWFGTNGGVSRFDGSTWATFTTAEGLANNSVTCILEDHSGNLWLGTMNGLSRFDGTAWRNFTTADGLAHNYVNSILEDRSGNLWFGTNGGVSRFDGSTWATFTTADGLAHDAVTSILEDRAGNLWFGTFNGLSRYDGAGWRTFGIAEGLANYYVLCMTEDRTGSLWFGTLGGGFSRFDGSTWRDLTMADGLIGSNVRALLEDRSGSLWIGTDVGLSRYDPDRIPPQTVMVIAPPRVTAAREHAFAFAALAEVDRIEFSYRLDGGPWFGWSRTGTAFLTALADGLHVFEARSRDYLTNTDETPTQAVFEVDATAPTPVIATPTFGQAVKARVEVRGTASDARFTGYRLEVRPHGARSWNPPDGTLLAESRAPVSTGPLGTWDTSPFPDGDYELQLSVTDSLGLTGAAQVTVIVDNNAPFADVTTPARVSAANGGNIFTTNGGVHVYFPPHAFRDDALVTILPAAEGSVPDTLASGAVLASPGFEIDWGAVPLRTTARLEISRAALPGSSAGALALYHSSDGSAWTRLGGTVSGDLVEAPIREPGRYALFVDAGVIPGRRTLSVLSFTPRVFSPTGAFADREVGIGFTLGRPAPVTVRIYARNGRLIRDVLVKEWMNTGANLVRWDGTDRNGGFVMDGIYLVTVEVPGHTETKPLAVVK